MRSKDSATFALDGSGNGSASVSLPTSRLVGAYVNIGTASSVPVTIANMGRTIVAKTLSASGYLPLGELLDAANGSASTSYGEGGAVAHGVVTITVASGTASATGLSVTLFYE